LFSTQFVGTTGYSRNCMTMGNLDISYFQAFGFTNIWTVPYLSKIIHYRGSDYLSSFKLLVLATEIQYTLYVVTPTSISGLTLPVILSNMRAVMTCICLIVGGLSGENVT